MSISSVSGKNWVFKKFDTSDIIKFSEDYSVTEIVAKLLSIRKKNIEDIKGTQNIFNHRAKMCTLAAQGKWSSELENK